MNKQNSTTNIICSSEAVKSFFKAGKIQGFLLSTFLFNIVLAVIVSGIK